MTASEQYRFILTNGLPDSSGHITDVAGWDLARYRANPVVFFNHQWQTPPIGRTTEIQITPDRIEATIELADTALASEVANLIRTGFIRGASVAWRPTEWELRRDSQGRPIGVHSHRQELIEVSIVGIPANPETLRVARLKDSQETGQLTLAASEDYLQAIFSAPPQDQLPADPHYRTPRELDDILAQLRAFNAKLRG